MKLDVHSKPVRLLSKVNMNEGALDGNLKNGKNAPIASHGTNLYFRALSPVGG